MRKKELILKYNKLLKEVENLKTKISSLTIRNDVLVREKGELIVKNDKLKEDNENLILLNTVLNEEKNKSVSKKISSQKKWLHGYYDEKVEG